MSGRKKTGQGRKGKQTPENSPKKNKVDDTISDISENKPTPEKNPSLSTSLVLESIPREIEDLKLCKTLQDLAHGVWLHIALLRPYTAFPHIFFVNRAFC
jgi:hypothetical protein